MKVFLIFIIFCHRYYLVESVGETCVMNDQLTRGECKLIQDCPEVRRKSHKTCGYTNDFIEIVCCPVKFVSRSDFGCSTQRTHEKKCQEYAQLYQKNPNSKCHIRTTGFISGGVQTEPKEFPHMALLGYDAGGFTISWKCGGTLISDLYVLTAAHCLLSAYDLKLIRLGELDYSTNTDEAKPEDFGFNQIITHPEYDSGLKFHDIGLIQLNRTVEFSSYIYPACLPISMNFPIKNNIATGWGSTSARSKTSSYLLKVALNSFTYDECKEIYSEINYNKEIRDSIQICAGSITDNKDTCGGDSGGPLQIFHTCPDYCIYTILGITSFGPQCANSVPGIFTRVFPYNDWIESIVWQ